MIIGKFNTILKILTSLSDGHEFKKMVKFLINLIINGNSIILLNNVIQIKYSAKYVSG